MRTAVESRQFVLPKQAFRTLYRADRVPVDLGSKWQRSIKFRTAFCAHVDIKSTQQLDEITSDRFTTRTGILRYRHNRSARITSRRGEHECFYLIVRNSI